MAVEGERLAAGGASGCGLRFGGLDTETFKMLRVCRFAIVQGLGEDAVGLGANPADHVAHGLECLNGEERDAADAVEILADFFQVGTGNQGENPPLSRPEGKASSWHSLL